MKLAWDAAGMTWLKNKAIEDFPASFDTNCPKANSFTNVEVAMDQEVVEMESWDPEKLIVPVTVKVATARAPMRATIKDIKVLDAIFSGVLLQRDSNNKRTDVLTIVTTVAWQMELLQMTIVEGNIKFGAQDNDRTAVTTSRSSSPRNDTLAQQLLARP
eukprot:gene726-1027_t